MARGIRARRYAQAVFEIALERQELDKWQSDLGMIASLGEDAALIALLENPKIHFDDKIGLLSEQLGYINSLALNLVYLLVVRGRLSMAGDIAEEYQRLMNNYLGIEQGEIVTAVPLDDEDRLRLTEHLGAAVGKEMILNFEVDSGLIGGFIARISDKLLDGSTRSKLEALKRELVGVGR